MELVSYRIDVQNLPDKKFVFSPMGDIQWDGTHESTSVKSVKEHIKEVLDRNGKFLGMGDYIDFASPSNRQRLLSAALYDTAQQVIDSAASNLLDSLRSEMLEPTKGHWLGMLEGHHFLQLQTGYTTDQMLCDQMQTVFLGTSAYVGLQFVDGKQHLGVVNIWCHHGVGSGVSVAAPVQKLERVAGIWGAHIYLMGHHTKRAFAPVSYLYPEWNTGKRSQDSTHKLRHIERQLVGTGGFSRAYQERCMQGNVPRGGYVEKGMLMPTAIGAPIITIEPRQVDHKIDGVRHNYFQPKIRVEA